MAYERAGYHNGSPSGSALATLQEICSSYSPVGRRELDLVEDQSPLSRLEDANLTIETHLTRFYHKAVHVYDQLGSWAADHYVRESVALLARKSADEASSSLYGGSSARDSLLAALDRVRPGRDPDPPSPPSEQERSPKLNALLAFLESLDADTCVGLIFVQQRAVVSILCTLLSIHPRLSTRFRCATFVGQSNSSSRRFGIAELLDLKAQNETLTDFRAGRKNLVIATSVLEEGIDVAACNLVLCFDPPANVKSFIQRRGRARHEASRFVMMAPNDEGRSLLDEWQLLEEELSEIFMTDREAPQQLEDEPDDDAIVPGKLVVETTG